MDLQKELDRCAKCGQCRSVCPVFLALKDETLVARGRLAIIDAITKMSFLRKQESRTDMDSRLRGNDKAGRVDISDLYTKILNTCLMCRRCEENCPSLVNTSEVFKSERQRLAREKGLPLLLRLGFRWVLPNRWIYDNVMRLASWVVCLIRLTHNAQRTTQGAPIRHLPLYFANLFQRLPRLASRSALQIRNPQSAIRNQPKVSIFLGCAANYIYPEIIEALTSVLNHLQIPYVIPSQQVCCGMPALLSGDIKTAEQLSRINQGLFKTDPPDGRAGTIITVCPTCNRMFKEMGSEFGVRSKIIDAIEFLQPGFPELPTPNSTLRTSYHQPCHSVGTKAPEIIRSFLKATTDYQEIEDVCCGGGGLFTFKYPELSDLIGKTRLKGILDVNTPHSVLRTPNYLVTNCPGCMMQLEYLLSANNIANMKVKHVLNLYSDYLHGNSGDTILNSPLLLILGRAF